MYDTMVNKESLNIISSKEIDNYNPENKVLFIF